MRDYKSNVIKTNVYPLKLMFIHFPSTGLTYDLKLLKSKAVPSIFPWHHSPSDDQLARRARYAAQCVKEMKTEETPNPPEIAEELIEPVQEQEDVASSSLDASVQV